MLQPVATYQNEWEAQVACTALSAEGIEAQVLEHAELPMYLYRAQGMRMNVFAVAVAPDVADQARQLLEEQRKPTGDGAPEPAFHWPTALAVAGVAGVLLYPVVSEVYQAFGIWMVVTAVALLAGLIATAYRLRM